MKRKYVSVKVRVFTAEEDIVTLSGPSDDPNVDDGYDLSGFTGLFKS